MAEQANGNLETQELLPGFKDASVYSQFLLRAALQATKASNGLPTAGDQYDFYHSFKGFRRLMREEGKRILSLMTSVVHQQGETGHFEGKELDDLVDQLICVNDAVLERASSEMDDASGIKKKQTDVLLSTVRTTKVINTSWNRKDNRTRSVSYQLLAAKNILRPQIKFQDLIDNGYSPFVPIIKDKPNSLKPLAILLESIDGQEEYSHPYEVEIEKCMPHEDILKTTDAIKPLPVENTELVFIQKVEDLHNLCHELKKCTEIAVDLEHHSYRTFQGLTCLMQISTRDKDYIVDVLELRRDMHVMNEVFTDPKIIKVFHGADMDVLWLQRDFGLYVVNMFDTGQAARLLNFPHLSLYYLMSHYCQVHLNKQFQLADWRIRPLPAEMLRYAREDTHFLLFIYDLMRNELINSGNAQNNLLRAAFENSKRACLKRYRKPVFNDDSYLEMYKKSKKCFNRRQMYALQHLYAWREKTARTEDECTGYVLPNHMLLQLAEVLPREQQGILACCNPIPPLVKHQLNELHAIIYKAREHALTKLDVPEPHFAVASSRIMGHANRLNPLNCPHDLPPTEDRQLPTLLDLRIHKLSPATSKLMKKNADVTIFGAPDDATDSKEDVKDIQSVFKDFISPYERYKIAKEKQLQEVVIENTEPSAIETGPTDEERVQRLQQFYKELVANSNQEETVPESETVATEWDDETIPRSLRELPRKKHKKSRTPFGQGGKKRARDEEFSEPSTSFQPFNYENYSAQTPQSEKRSKNWSFTPGRGQNFPGGKSQKNRRNKRKQMSYRNSQGSTQPKWPNG